MKSSRKRKRKSSSKSTRKKKRRKKKYTYDEYELQKDFHTYYSDNYPENVSCGTPYCYMKPATRAKVMKKGYMKGFPDYFIYDPRVAVKKKGGKIKIKVFNGIAIEFKAPSGKGRLRKEQKIVLEYLEKRGYLVYKKVKSMERAKEIVDTYQEMPKLYDGWIKINPEDRKVTLPKKKDISETLPGRKEINY